MRAGVVVFAIGNPSRGDDALGPLLLARLAQWLAAQARGGEFELIDDFQLQIEHALDLQGRRLALFIDAGCATPAPFSFYPIVHAASSATSSTHALPPEGVLDFGMAAVYDHAVAGYIGGRKEGKTHDVVPVQMGHEDMIGLRRPRPEAFQHRLAKRARPAAEVENHVLGSTGFHLHATGVAAVGAGNVETQRVDVGFDFVRRREITANAAGERRRQLGAHGRRGD